MKIKIYSLLLLLCFFTTVQGNNALPTNLASSEDVCALAPPSVLNVVMVGPTWADLTWPAVSGANHYRVRTYEASTGVLVDDGTAPFNLTSYRVNNLTPGVTYYSRIWTVCQNWEESSTFTQSNNYDAIIIDYVSTGYNGSGNGGWNYTGCVLPLYNSGQFTGCDFYWSSASYTYFNIESPMQGKQLRFRVNVVGNTVKLYPDVADEDCCGNNGQFTFQNEGNHHVKIYDGQISQGKLIARLSAARPTAVGPGKLFRQNENSDDNIMQYAIKTQTPQLMGDPTDRETTPNAEGTNPQTQLSASPNPFTNLLEVQIPYATEEEAVNLNLYDLQGRLVLAQQSHGGPQIRYLSTEDLLPGLYLLRVDTGDRSETIKVMKTQ